MASTLARTTSTPATLAGSLAPHASPSLTPALVHGVIRRVEQAFTRRPAVLGSLAAVANILVQADLVLLFWVVLR